MLSTLLFGAMFGAQHVLAGPDHLAALAPLSGRAKGAWRIGLAWGLGHGGISLALGACALALGHLLGLEAFAAHAERWVGASIVLLGAWSLRRTHRPEHDHAAQSSNMRAAFLVGTLHGFAGGLHLAGLIPAAALAHPWVYLCAFVLGSIATMSLVTGVAGPWLAKPQRRERAVKLSAWLAIAVGCVWIALA